MGICAALKTTKKVPYDLYCYILKTYNSVVQEKTEK